MDIKIILIGILGIVIILISILLYKYSTKSISNEFNFKEELSDEDLLKYATSPFNKKKMMGKTIILGRHNGIVVKAYFPCGDICPDYTKKIIMYDVELENCEKIGGIRKKIYVPSAIAMKEVEYCIPQIIADVIDSNKN